MGLLTGSTVRLRLLTNLAACLVTVALVRQSGEVAGCQPRCFSHPRDQTTAVIAMFSRQPSRVEVSSIKALGATGYRRLGVIDGAAFSLPQSRVRTLLGMPFVQSISPDETTRKCDAFTVASSHADTASEKYGLTGYGVGVAVLDTGISPEPDFEDPILKDRLVASVNFTKEDGADFCGHGTHVAGIIAGNGATSERTKDKYPIYGIARRANLISVKVLDRTGRGTVSDAIEGVDWCVRHAKEYSIRVLNISFGHPVGQSYRSDPLCRAVEKAWKAGIVVVCAAGNDGRLKSTTTVGASNEGYGSNYGSIESPGNDPYVITVGAMRRTDKFRANDKIATYSSRGPSICDFVLKPDIVAPGNKVVSVEPDICYLAKTYPKLVIVQRTHGNRTGWSKDYCRLSGTSMATPVVAGAVAMMLQRYPFLSPDTVKERLMLSSDKWTDSASLEDACTFGAGYLNIPAALQCDSVCAAPCLSPCLGKNKDDVFIRPETAVWIPSATMGASLKGSHSIWGNHSIWGKGGNVVDSTHSIWGKGGNVVDSTHSIWGKGGNVVDSTHAIWGASLWDATPSGPVSAMGVDLSASSVEVLGDR